jgi:hypothetical protein
MHGNQIIPVVCRVSSRNPESSTFHIPSGSLQETLQYYNSWYKYITSELKSGSITDHKFTNHHLIITNHKFLS